MVPDFHWGHDFPSELFLGTGGADIIFDLLDGDFTPSPYSLIDFGRMAEAYFFLKLECRILNEVLLCTLFHLFYNKALQVDETIKFGCFLQNVYLFDLWNSLFFLLHQKVFLLFRLFHHNLLRFFFFILFLLKKVYQLNLLNCTRFAFHWLVDVLWSFIEIEVFLFIGRSLDMFLLLRRILHCLFFIILKSFVDNAHKICKLVISWLFLVRSMKVLIQILVSELHGFEDIFIHCRDLRLCLPFFFLLIHL